MTNGKTMRLCESAAVLGLLALASGPLLASGLYKWVDKDGKVHYSQTRPIEQPRAESEVKVQKAPADDGSEGIQADRDADGKCVSMKCLADQMEADRLARERGYADRRAENERAARKPAQVPEAPPTLRTAADKQLQENCRNGLFAGTNSKVNCDDTASLRREHERNKPDVEAAKRDAARRGDWGLYQRLQKH